MAKRLAKRDAACVHERDCVFTASLRTKADVRRREMVADVTLAFRALWLVAALSAHNELEFALQFTPDAQRGGCLYAPSAVQSHTPPPTLPQVAFLRYCPTATSHSTCIIATSVYNTLYVGVIAQILCAREVLSRAPSTRQYDIAVMQACHSCRAAHSCAHPVHAPCIEASPRNLAASTYSTLLSQRVLKTLLLV